MFCKHRIFIITAIVIFLTNTWAFAAATSPERAQKVVKGWLKQGNQRLGALLGNNAKSAQTYKDAAGVAIYHIVYLNPSGYLIVSADDKIEPIIAFISSGVYDPSSSNPLGALVEADMKSRIAAIPKKQQGAVASRSNGSNSNKWSELEQLADMNVASRGISSVSDERVTPLTQSHWNQSNVAGAACYNYYTPPYAEGSSSNYPSGCVATAMGQLMRFYQYPATGVGTSAFTIYVNGASQSRNLRGGNNGGGGPYSWSDMPLAPDSSIITTQRQAIGALIADAGVSVNMNYTSSGSGSNMLNIPYSLVDTFGYTNSIAGYNNMNDIGAGLNAMVNPNLDALYPVILGVAGSAGGHAIICDGYGYSSSTLYHHLNMGWSGSGDAWYNLPTIDSIYTFTIVNCCIYNTYITGNGEIISGRVIDTSGNPISDVAITANRSGGGTYTATTNARGIYALAKIPSASSYTIFANKTGYLFDSQIISTGTSANLAATSGNFWGGNFTSRASPPTVSFTSANQSLTESGGAMTITAQLATALSSPVTVPFTLSGTATLNTDYTITASPITIPAGSTNGTITITIINDTLNENNETVIVTMGTPTNATLGAITIHTATINDDDDPLPTVSFTSASQSLTESGGTMTITAQLSTASALLVTAPFTLSGTATLNTDYTITASPITIPAGSTTGTITITIINDTQLESDETIIVTIGAPTNATLGATTTHTATINDDEAPPLLLTSGPTAAPNTVQIAEAVQFSCVANKSVTWVWNFGDGTTSTAVTPTHTYTVAGTYNVTVTATYAPLNQTVSGSVSVIVLAAPLVPPTITSSLTGATLINTPYNYTITATGSAPIAFGATNLPSGLTRSGAVISGAPTVAGVAMIVLTATNAAGTDTKTLMLTINKIDSNSNSAPTFTTLPTALPNPGTVGEEVTFTANATDPDGDLLSYAWDFGDGVYAYGATVTHIYANAKLYAARVVVSDGSASVSRELNLGVNNADGANGDQKDFTVLKAMIKLNFSKENADNIALFGTLPIPPDFTPKDKTVIIAIGDYESAFTLNAKGKAVSLPITNYQLPITNYQSMDSLKLVGKLKNGSYVSGPLKFIYTVKKQNLFDKLNDYGFDNADVAKPGDSIDLPVLVSIDDDSYFNALTVVYTATKDKRGSAKK